MSDHPFADYVAHLSADSDIRLVNGFKCTAPRLTAGNNICGAIYRDDGSLFLNRASWDGKTGEVIFPCDLPDDYSFVLPAGPRAASEIAIGAEYRLSNPGAFMRAERIEQGAIQGVIYTRTGRRISNFASWDLITHRIIGYAKLSGAPADFDPNTFDLHDAVPRIEPAPPRTAADVLNEMAATYREKNETYGAGYQGVARVMSVLFPKGIELRDADNFLIWNLFGHIVAKIVRFANSELTHIDSVHDIGAYAAILQRELENKPPPIKPPSGDQEGD